MKKASIWKILSVTAALVTKIPKALEDGNISINEIVDIISSICDTLDIPVNFNVPDELKTLNISVLENK